MLKRNKLIQLQTITVDKPTASNATFPGLPATKVRFILKRWSGNPCMRIELRGCTILGNCLFKINIHVQLYKDLITGAKSEHGLVSKRVVLISQKKK